MPECEGEDAGPTEDFVETLLDSIRRRLAEEATLEAGRTRLEAVIASLHLKAHRPTGDIGPFYKPFGLQPKLRDTVPVWLLGESPTPLTLSRLVSASCPQPT